MAPKSLLQNNPYLRNAKEFQRALRASVLSSIAIESVRKVAERALNPTTCKAVKNGYLRITLEPGKRGGRPCIRGLRISVYDVLEMLAEGMDEKEIIEDFSDLESQDIRACLAFAADREHKLYSFAV